MYFDKFKKIVIKVGSSILIDEQGKPKKVWLKEFAKDIQNFIRKKKQIVIVSSGAIAMGCEYLDIKKNGLKVDKSQAIASIGQIELMDFYKNIFNKNKIKISQILLTLDDTEQIMKKELTIGALAAQLGDHALKGPAACSLLLVAGYSALGDGGTGAAMVRARRCAQCGREAGSAGAPRKLLRCGGCPTGAPGAGTQGAAAAAAVARYCDAACQRAHWKAGHKDVCRPVEERFVEEDGDGLDEGEEGDHEGDEM